LLRLEVGDELEVRERRSFRRIYGVAFMRERAKKERERETGGVSE
jgi:hypothetical protein